MPDYTFNDDGVRRIVRAVRGFEGLSRQQSLRKRDAPHAESPPALFLHLALGSTDVVPPFGVMAIVATTITDDNIPLYITQVPSTTFRQHYMVNGDESVPNNEYGAGWITDPPVVLYSTPPSTAFQGYGPKPGSWALDQYYPQCSEAIGIVSESSGMKATLHPIRELLVKNTTESLGASTDRDLEVLFGASPSETTSGWRVNVKTLNQTIGPDEVFTVKEVNGQWYPAQAGEDVKLAVSDQNNGAYASTLFTIWNASTEYVADHDIVIDAEPAGTTPDQQVRLFIDASTILGYTSNIQQFLTHDSSDIIRWATGTAGGVDEKLAATSENDGTYWNELHSTGDVNTSTVFNSTQDLTIESEIYGTTPNQKIKLFADMSDVANWTGAGHQFFMTGSSAGLVWRNANNINVTTVYNTSQDLLVEPELDGSNLMFMVDVSGIPSYSTAAEQYLTNSSGVTKWTSGTGGADEKVAISSGDTPNYLGTLLTGYSTVSAFEIGNDLFVDHEYNAGEILSFIDASSIPNYSAVGRQYLSHSSDAEIQWTTGIGGGTDELLAATSENNGVYWAGLHAEFNATTTLSTNYDFIIESEVSGTTPNQDIRLYLKSYNVSGYAASTPQILGHSSTGTPVWTRDEKVAIGSTHTPQFLGESLTGYSTVAAFELGNDLLVDHEENGSEIVSFVDSGDIPGYSAGTIQFLGHSSGATLQWTTGIGGGTDELMAASSENSGKYWATLHNEYNGTTTLSTNYDIVIESEVAGTTPNQTIRLYWDLSDVSGYDISYEQLFTKDSTGRPKFRYVNDLSATTVFNSVQDIAIKSEIISAGFTFFFDISSVDGFSAGTAQILGHDTSGIPTWTRDEKVAISSGHTPNYLGTLLTGYSTAATFELDNDLTVDFEENGSEILAFIDSSPITGYSATVPQFLSHTSGANLAWTTGTGGGTDELLAATSENDGKYWSALHNEFISGSPELTTGKDLLVDSQVAGTTPNQTIRLFIDVSDITGYDASTPQFLMHDSSGFTKWIGTSTCA